MSKIVHFYPDNNHTKSSTTSFCLCGCNDGNAIIVTSLGRTNCIDCIKVATRIAKEVPDLFAFYKSGIMADGSVQEKR